MRTSAPAFVAMSKFVVANGDADAVKDAFRRRPGLVDREPGFLRLEVWCPLDLPDEIWLVTYWIDAAHFDRWHRSHRYHESHVGIPKGLKLVRGETLLRRFDRICT